MAHWIGNSGRGAGYKDHGPFPTDDEAQIYAAESGMDRESDEYEIWEEVLDAETLTGLMDLAFARVTDNRMWVHHDGTGCSLIELLVEMGNKRGTFTYYLHANLTRVVQMTFPFLNEEDADWLVTECNKASYSVQEVQTRIRDFLLLRVQS